MDYCKICNKKTDKYIVKGIFGDNEPPRRVGIDLRYKTNIEVCPECGFMKLLGSDLPFTQMRYKGYPPVSIDDIKKIDTEQIINEMELPLIHSEEIKIWVEFDIFKNNLFEVDVLTDGITFDHVNYYRLVHFMLLPLEKRRLISGTFKCPFIEIAIETFEPRPWFWDGRRRFSLLHYLGVKRIPVAVLKDNLEIAENHGFKYYKD